jgi:outer membrane receptor protein involved in Fe transport
MWNITYIGKIFENCSALTTQLSECSLPNTVYPPTGSKGEHELNRVIYNDATFTYNIEPIRTNVTLGVQNVFNQSFPLEYTAGAPPNLDGEMGYRIPGRYIYARVGVKF